MVQIQRGVLMDNAFIEIVKTGIKDASVSGRIRELKSLLSEIRFEGYETVSQVKGAILSNIEELEKELNHE